MTSLALAALVFNFITFLQKFNCNFSVYSTVTAFAKLRGLSTSVPFSKAT